MLFLRYLAAAVFAITLGIGHAQAADDTTLSAKEKAAIEALVEELLVNKKPEIVMQALQEVQARHEKEEAQKSAAAMQEHTGKIFDDPNSPVGGNPKGDVTVVEFFDYQCGYCKMAHTAIDDLLKADKNVRFIYKNLPILGEASVVAAHAALASVHQGKFEVFHNALMENKERLDEANIMKIAKSAGLDTTKLKADMESDKVKAQVQTELDLGQSLGVRGTPMFIIGDEQFPGALNLDQLKKAVADARAKKG
ncbi:MAG: thioredoxin domain-containing protein [Alphaproteobacteria bacterium]|nr:thioredoxin domain-containing protein [Alphaproteobacteria bacterium]